MSLLKSTAISTIGSLTGGLLGDKSASKAANKDYRRQKEFAQNSVRWKVEDAKRAGLHPLFALGGGTNFSPSGIVGTGLGSAVAESSKNIQNTINSRSIPKGTPARQLHDAQLRESNARVKKDEAQAALALSEARRAQQALNSRQDTPLETGKATGVIRNLPAERVSNAPGQKERTAAKRPAFQRYQYGPRKDQWVDIPYSDEGPFEEFGPAKAIMTIQRMLQNRAKSAPLPKRRKSSRGRKRRLKR